MSYRNPNNIRIQHQQQEILQYVGQTATWRQYVSGESGNPIVGLAGTAYYQEQTITAIMGQYFLPMQGESQRPGGLVITGMFTVSTREQLDSRDELHWNNHTYRVAGESIPSRLGNLWLTPVQRGSG